MQLTREAPADRQLIQSYNPGQFRVNGMTFHGPVIVSAAAALPWNATSVSTLTLDSFAPLRDMKVDVCLLGCGAKMDRLPKALRDALKEEGLNVEPMDTGSACRTYNMLVVEGRKIAAALIPI